MTLKDLIKYIIPVSYHKADDVWKHEQKELKDIKGILYNIQSSEKELREEIYREFQRRDDWGSRADQIRREAGDQKLWVIKCPAPDNDNQKRWGDYYYAKALQKNLQKQAQYAVIDYREDWGCEIEADVVLVLRGLKFYRPDRRNAHCRYIMWNISHPDMVTDAEYELYDLVCVASNFYAEQLMQRIKTPVVPLLQCTDTDLFYPDKQTQKKYDMIFVGNSRGIARNSVMWALENKLDLHIWGSGWNSILKDHREIIEADHIWNDELPDLYRSARLTINDHWEDMRRLQYINNRIFDALACGLPVITDSCPELKEIFPEAVLHFETKEEFVQKIAYANHHYSELCEIVKDQWKRIQDEFSFSKRAEELILLAEKLSEQGGSDEIGNQFEN